MNITFQGENCVLRMARYPDNGRVAIVLVALDGEPLAKGTCNLPEEELAPDEVFVKDHSENEGMLDALETAGVAIRTGRLITAGYVTIPVARLLPEAMKLCTEV